LVLLVVLDHLAAFGLIGVSHGQLTGSVLDFVEDLSEDVLEILDVFGVAGGAEVGESVDLGLLLGGQFEGRDVVVEVVAEEAEEDVDRFDELGQGPAFAIFGVLVEEAVADKEVDLREEAAALEPLALCLLLYHSLVILQAVRVVLVHHEHVPGSRPASLQTIQHLLLLHTARPFPDLQQLCLVQPLRLQQIIQNDFFVVPLSLPFSFCLSLLSLLRTEFSLHYLGLVFGLSFWRFGEVAAERWIFSFPFCFPF
jgi:hypothetical protein